jgi:RNA polymerase sigma factor (sigma-70 family)
MTDPDCDLAPDPGAALAALYEAEWPKLLRVAYVLTDSLPTAEEIVQDAFVRLQSAPGVVANPGGYLRTTVVNACRDVHRHRAVVRRTPLPRSESTIDEHDELFDALASLPWRQQAALVLRFHVDLSDTDIAAALGCRPSTVRSIIRRALATLRKDLQS